MSLPQNAQTSSVVHTGSYCGTGTESLGMKRLGRAADR